VEVETKDDIVNNDFKNILQMKTVFNMTQNL